jgi:hypothetical protein
LLSNVGVQLALLQAFLELPLDMIGCLNKGESKFEVLGSMGHNELVSSLQKITLNATA